MRISLSEKIAGDVLRASGSDLRHFTLNGTRERIIAQAAISDEMLAALQMLVSDFGDYPASERPCLAFDRARALIARATDQGEMK